MAGTGIATFSDRLRDAVRGGGPFDDDPRIQGFASGLFTDPNGSPANGTAAEQRTRLLHYQDLIRLGLAANLRDYTFLDSTGQLVRGADVDYNGQPAGYAADPGETITYVDAHDNETLFDVLTHKLPPRTGDGRPGAHEHRRPRHDGARAESVVLARRQRSAALQVAGSQQLRLRRLVQPRRLVRCASRPSAPGSRRRPTTRASGTTCGRCSPTRRSSRMPERSRPRTRAPASCSGSASPRRCSGSAAPGWSRTASASPTAGRARRPA